MVARLETLAKRSPLAYKTRVALLAMLGYGYIFSVLAVLVAILVALVWAALGGKHLHLIGKLAIPLLLLAGVILRALWVRLEEPAGRELSAREAPALFAAIDDLRRRLRGPRIHRVLLTDEFNAAVVQTPRLGLFGWHKNHLIVGLPLMQALSPDQFRAVLAHEYGHLAGAHSRFAGWIYRVRKSWHQLMEALDKEGRATWLFRKFFDWYSPYFAGYSFVLARANEYQADWAAQELVGARHAADALLNINLKGSLLHERFWPGLHARADHTPEPAFSPYAQLTGTFVEALEAEPAENWLKTALARKTDSADTHPCLTDRLRALGQPPRIPEPVNESAAQLFFGTAASQLIEELDQGWRARINDSWRDRYAHVQKGKAEILRLREQSSHEELSVQEVWDLAYWMEQIEGGETALPLYQAVLARAEEEPAPQFAVGRLLLSRDDENGIEHLEKAMALDASRTAAACDWIVDFLHRRGRAAEARSYFDRMVEAQRIEAAAKDERSALTTRDKFTAHGLEEETLQDLREQLRLQPRIAKAWLARKVLTHLPDEEPVFGLAVKTVAWYPAGRKFVHQLCNELRGVGHMYIVLVNAFDDQTYRTIGRAIKKADGTLIYRR